MTGCPVRQLRPLLTELLKQTPAGWPLIDRIRAALLQGLRQLCDARHKYEPQRDGIGHGG